MTSLTPQQIELVQETFHQVHPLAKYIAEIFYTRLFALAPSVRPLFKDDLMTQHRKLMQMLAEIVDGLNRLDVVAPMLYELGKRHVGYGVEAEHYDVMREALLWMLERSLGDAWTPEVGDAWATAFDFMAQTARAGAERGGE